MSDLITQTSVGVFVPTDSGGCHDRVVDVDVAFGRFQNFDFVVFVILTAAASVNIIFPHYSPSSTGKNVTLPNIVFITAAVRDAAAFIYWKKLKL